MIEFYESYRDNLQYPTFWRVSNFGFDPHFHSSIELFYVTRGEVRAFADGESFGICEGELMALSSCAIHGYLYSGAAEGVMLIIPLDFISAMNPVLSSRKFASRICRDAAVNDEIRHCFEQLLRVRECTPTTVNIVRGYVYTILGLLVDAVGLKDAEKEDRSPPQEILTYLQNHYLSPVTLDIISRDFGYSKFRFSHLFSSYFQCSITEYVNSLRARHAANMLTQTETPLIDVAMVSGFESMRTFYRVFKICFGMTPSQYRNACLTGSRSAADLHFAGSESRKRLEE